jgi:hypothetical protein
LYSTFLIFLANPPNPNKEDAKRNEQLTESPQAKLIQPFVLTPYKVPDAVPSITPSSALHKNSQLVSMSPYLPSIAKHRASPFIPFCRENLSPLCSVDGNFASNNSKRMLFSPM